MKTAKKSRSAARLLSAFLALVFVVALLPAAALRARAAEGQTNIPVTGVAISPTAVTLGVGYVIMPNVTVFPSDATDKSVTWTSSNPAIAGADGVYIFGVSPGTAIVTATTTDGGFTATCEVTVYDPAVNFTGTGVIMNPAAATLTVGDGLSFTFTISIPTGASGETLVSSDPSIAVVNEDGDGGLPAVTAVSPGTATITYTIMGNYYDDAYGPTEHTFTATCVITVIGAETPPPSSAQFIVTFDANAADAAAPDPASKAVVNGQPYGGLAAAARPGYTFGGWYTTADGPVSGTKVESTDIVNLAAGQILYAYWTANTSEPPVSPAPTEPSTPPEPPVNGNPFTDIAGHWAASDILWAHDAGLVEGTSATTFEPNTPMTRAMLVTVLYRLDGSPAVTGGSPFADVPAGTWYTDAVTWAAQNGIVTGMSATSFAPGGDITREQTAAVLYRYASFKGCDTSASGDLSGFADGGSVSAYALDAVRWAVGAGLMNGQGGVLNPLGGATRAEVVTILHRFADFTA